MDSHFHIKDDICNDLHCGNVRMNQTRLAADMWLCLCLKLFFTLSVLGHGLTDINGLNKLPENHLPKSF